MNGVPFCARIPALKTLVPAVPPLSFMKTTKVFWARPRASIFAKIWPTF